MAEEKLDDVEVVDGTEGGKSKKMIIIIAVVVLALLGGAAAMFLGGDDAKEEDDSAEVEEVATAKQPPIFISMEKPLIVRFKKQSNGAVRYIRVNFEVMARDQAIIDSFTLHQPAIKHDLLLLLLSQKYDILNSPDGNDVLQDQALETINTILSSNESGPLEAVYTDYLMQ